MALNDIRLNSIHLAQMYRATLVDIPNTQEEPATMSSTAKPVVTKGASKSEKLATEWKSLGTFKKSILWIVRYPATTYLPDEQLTFLTSILDACKLNLADVAILNISNDPAAGYQRLQNEFRSKVTILFGITPQELEMPINFPEFQIQPFNNCVFLHAPVLEKLESDKILKSKLWVCLRRIFNLP